MITNDFLPCIYLRLVDNNRDLKAILLNTIVYNLQLFLSETRKFFVLQVIKHLVKLQHEERPKYTITYTHKQARAYISLSSYMYILAKVYFMMYCSCTVYMLNIHANHWVYEVYLLHTLHHKHTYIMCLSRSSNFFDSYVSVYGG